MRLTVGTSPVRHFVWDNFLTPEPSWVVPGAADPSWEVRYDNELERGKRTARRLPDWAAVASVRMMAPDVVRVCDSLLGTSAFPDPSLWGGGLQVISPHGYLGTHLDGQIHPKRPHLRRAVQLVCFCHPEWRHEWGGQFYFTDTNGEVVKKVEPLPGRLLAFENDALAYHGVLPVTGDRERVTVSASLLGDARLGDVQTRALFLPARGS